MSGDGHSPLATRHSAEHAPFTGAPDPEFEVVSARAVERAAAPTLAFKVRAGDESGRRLFTIALTAVITIEPSKRRYDEPTRERLFELFGEPQRWASTTTNLTVVDPTSRPTTRPCG